MYAAQKLPANSASPAKRVEWAPQRGEHDDTNSRCDPQQIEQTPGTGDRHTQGPHKLSGDEAGYALWLSRKRGSSRQAERTESTKCARSPTVDATVGEAPPPRRIRAGTVPAGPSSSNRLLAIAAPIWVNPIDNTTRPVGGTPQVAALLAGTVSEKHEQPVTSRDSLLFFEVIEQKISFSAILLLRIQIAPHRKPGFSSPVLPGQVDRLLMNGTKPFLPLLLTQTVDSPRD